GTTAEELIKTGLRIKESGIELSDFVMPGLGGNLNLEGEETWKKHAEETARVMNETNPDWIRLRTLHIYPNTPLYQKKRTGEFQRLSDPDIVEEIRLFIEDL
ncbi:radical SAM protein, partial [Patescibacteria group bacterium]|nr:radical SAM protein [Patescibacteria group bacterium]